MCARRQGLGGRGNMVERCCRGRVPGVSEGRVCVWSGMAWKGKASYGGALLAGELPGVCLRNLGALLMPNKRRRAGGSSQVPR